jgi:hypothetical protein
MRVLRLINIMPVTKIILRGMTLYLYILGDYEYRGMGK